MFDAEEVAQDLEHALGQAAALCEEVVTNTQNGLSLLQQVLFGGGAETYFAAVSEFSMQAVAAAQRYSELQFEWALQGY